MKYVSAGNKKYRLGRKNFIKYYDKLPENAVCILYTYLKKIDDSLSDDESLSINGKKYALCDMPNKYRTLGYLETDEPNLYVCILVKRSLLPLGLVSLLSSCSSSVVYSLLSVVVISGAVITGAEVYQYIKETGNMQIGIPSSEKEATGDENVSSYDSENNDIDISNQKYTVIDAITYEGDYMDIYESDTVPFGNSPENEGIYLQYVVKDSSGNEIYVSPKINPGEKIDWSPAKYLNSGIQPVVISVNVYHQDTNMQDVGTDMNVKFNIHK